MRYIRIYSYTYNMVFLIPFDATIEELRSYGHYDVIGYVNGR